MLDVSAAERATMLNAVRKIQNSLKRSIAILKCDRFLADSRWRMVEEMTEVDYPYKGLVMYGIFDGEKLTFSFHYKLSTVQCGHFADKGDWVLQMRTFAFFSAMNLAFFEIYDASSRTRERGVDPVWTRWSGSIFLRFCANNIYGRPFISLHKIRIYNLSKFAFAEL